MVYRSVQRKVKAVENDGSIKCFAEIYNVSDGRCEKGRGNTIVAEDMHGNRVKVPHNSVLILGDDMRMSVMEKSQFEKEYEPEGE